MSIALPQNRSETPDRPLVETAAVLAVVAVAALWSWYIQQFQVFRLWDSDEYFALAEQLASGRAVTASAPYAYRVLTPWIVARCCAANIQHGFLAVNIVAGALSAVVLAIWLRRFVPDWRVRVLVAAAYVWEWHAPVRFVYYYPAYVDPLLLLFLPLGLIFVERVAERGRAVDIAALVAITGVGVLAREMMVLVPMSALLHPAFRSRVRGAGLSALGGSIAAVILATIVAHRGTNPRVAYSFFEAALYHLRHKPLFSLVLTWFMTFGPVVALVAYDWRGAVAFLRERPHLALYLLACACLSYIGGHDTERYLIWAAPVMYVLIGQAIVRHGHLFLSAALVGVLLAGQLVSERVFWPIPDPTSAVAALGDLPSLSAKAYSVLNRLFIIDDFHWNLWSNFGSRPFHMLLLALYGAFSALVIIWMRSLSLRDPWTSKHVEI